MIGPLDFEIAWNKAEQKTVESLNRIPWIKPLLVVVCFSIAYLMYSLWTSSQFPNWSRIYIAQDRIWSGYIVVVASFIPLFVKSLRTSSIFLLLVISCSWAYPIFRLESLTLLTFSPILFLIASSVITNLGHYSKWLKLTIVLSLFVVTIFSLTYESILNNGNKSLIYFSTLHLDMLFIYFIGAIFNSKSVPYRLHFNPIQFFSPLPLPESTDSNSKNYDKLFVQGILELFQSQLLFLIIILSYQTFYVKTTQNPFVQYILFIAFVVGSMKAVTAFLWIYGIATPGATHFVALSKSPIEVWQRGSVFIASFLFTNIYLPIWKRTRIHWLAAISIVLAILFHLFLFHDLFIKSLLRMYFGDHHFGQISFLGVQQQLFWVLAWIVWIMVFSVLQKLLSRWNSNKLYQWLLVMITHAGSALIIPILIFLAGILKLRGH